MYRNNLKECKKGGKRNIKTEVTNRKQKNKMVDPNSKYINNYTTYK